MTEKEKQRNLWENPLVKIGLALMAFGLIRSHIL